MRNDPAFNRRRVLARRPALDQDAFDGKAPARPTLGASIACFRDGAVLLARRGRAPMRGVWSLPGGRVEFGETAAEAAVREILEETGVVAEASGLADLVEIIEPGTEGAVERHIVVLAFAGRWISGEARTGEEALEVAWFAPADVEALDTTPGLAGVVKRAEGLVR